MAGDVNVKVRDGDLTISVPITKAEAQHLERQLEDEGELAHRAAAMHLIKRAVFADRDKLTKDADAARAAKQPGSGGKGKLTVDVPVAKGEGVMKKVGR